jgi:GT2 family glycosyltransferase
MKLSIIVATRNRAHAIGGCLNAIAAALANAAPLDAEIVITDNGSTDDTAAVIRSWSDASGFPVQQLNEPMPGLSRAHNRALRAARGELLAFTDDDCRMHPAYVNDLLRHDAADTEAVVRGGRIDLGDPTDLPLTIITRAVRKRWSRAMKSARHENIGDSLAGCNMTMRRTVVERLGPFDESMGSGSRIGAGNDIDYVYRAYLAGIPIEYVPDMAVAHFHGRKTASAGKALMQRYMQGSGALLAKHALRDLNLARPFYWDVKHAVREIITGSNTFLPAIGFSHRDKVRCVVRGAVAYLLTRKTAMTEAFGAVVEPRIPIA